MGSLLTRPVARHDDAHSHPQLQPLSACAEREQGGEKGDDVVDLTRPAARKRLRVTEQQPGRDLVPAANGPTAPAAESVPAEAVRAAAKRKRNEQTARRTTPKRQRGNRKRKSEATNLSDMFDEIDLSLECNLCHKQFQSHAQQICHNPCFYQRKGMTAEPVQWTCPECHKFFNRIGVLRQHMTIHFEGKFCCKQCGLRATRRNLIVDHITKKHLQ